MSETAAPLRVLIMRLEPNEVGGFTARMRGGQTVEISRQAARDLRRQLGLRG